MEKNKKATTLASLAIAGIVVGAILTVLGVVYLLSTG